MATHGISGNGKIPKQILYTAAAAGVLIAGNAVYKELTKYNLQDKVVLVTGGSRGLGLVLCRLLAKKGAKLAVCARSVDQIERGVKELRDQGAQIIGIPANVQDVTQATQAVNETIRHYGRLDVLINNAGTVQVGPVQTMTMLDFEEAMKTNFWAALYTTFAALPQFKKQNEGRIVNISSIGGKIAVPHLLPYTASKFALTGFSEGLHAELSKSNIHVLTVIPHLMRTGSTRNITVKGDHEAEYAWFKLSDSSSLMAMDVGLSARKIIRSLEYGKSETILGVTAKLATIANGLAPGWVTALLTLANRFLPASKPGGLRAKKGFEAESPKSQGPVAAKTDRASVENNEL
ncbi:MAG TPA: SDR family NAD(P)-dependent oxidoreductase [Chryseosolibacter sp.]|nr:SDR family NAD(P)-dependent oxidoreductase [Chryseosolibacter sp.]